MNGVRISPEVRLVPSNSFQFERLKELRSWLYREVKLAKYSSILDIGAGDLRISAEMAERAGVVVHAVDLVAPSRVPGNVRFFPGDANDLPFADGAFDLVAASFFFVWMNDIDRVLKEAGRVLKKEGLLLVLSEPQYRERWDLPDTGFNEYFKRGMEALGANMDIEGTLLAGLGRCGFTPWLSRTGGSSEIGRRAEVLEELDFLLERGVLDMDGYRRTRALESAAEGREVYLPVVYGYASL